MVGVVVGGGGEEAQYARSAVVELPLGVGDNPVGFRTAGRDSANGGRGRDAFVGGEVATDPRGGGRGVGDERADGWRVGTVGAGVGAVGKVTGETGVDSGPARGLGEGLGEVWGEGRGLGPVAIAPVK